MPVRVTHILPQLALKSGGPTRSVLGLTRAQAALGADVTLVVGSADETQCLETGLVHVVEAPLLSVRFGVPGARLVRILDEAVRGADVVHLHSHWNVITTAAAALARHHRNPYVISPRGMLDARGMSRRALVKRVYFAALEKRTVAGARAWLLLDESEREGLWHGAQPAAGVEVLVTPNGVDLAHVQALAESGRKGAPKGQERTGPLELVFLGRLHPIKGLDVQVEAVALLAARGIEAKLTLIGPDSGFGAELRAQAERLGVGERVHMPGPAYGDDRFSALLNADAVLLTSVQEGFSNTAAETLAVGGLLVAADTCHLEEAGKAGAAVIVPRTAQAVADALARVATDAAFSAAMRARAKLFADEHLDWRAIAAKILGLYERIRD